MAAAIEEYAGKHPLALDDIVGREQPLVIRRLCHDWPMVRMAQESDTAFAEGLAPFDNGSLVDVMLMPPSEQGVVGYNATMDGFNYAHHRVTLTQVLKRLAHYSREDSAPGLALQSALMSHCAPALGAQCGVPFLAPTIQPRLWIGNQVTTPTHFDEFHNIACVVAGVRRFTLFPPEQVRNLYIGPLDFAPTGAAISMARLDQLDDPQFPRLKQAMAEALTAELEAGDAIYIPPLWWHHIASLKRLNALVNYWWKPAAASGLVPTTALGCLMHCILAFKSLTPAERSAWKVLLNHYVFDEEDPSGHIPQNRRGMLGPMTPEMVEALKETIRNYL